MYKDIADKGEAEDTELAHINKFEAQLLKRVGGLGKKNPVTGLRGFLGGGGSGGGSPAPAPSQPEKTTQITREAPEIEARKLALFDEAIELGTMPIPVPAIQVAPPSPLQQQQFAQQALADPRVAIEAGRSMNEAGMSAGINDEGQVELQQQE